MGLIRAEHIRAVASFGCAVDAGIITAMGLDDMDQAGFEWAASIVVGVVFVAFVIGATILIERRRNRLLAENPGVQPIRRQVTTITVGSLKWERTIETRPQPPRGPET